MTISEALYVEVSGPHETHRGSGYLPPLDMGPVAYVHRVHVMSSPARGEVRSYWMDGSKRLWLAAPCYSGVWADVDLYVAAHLSAELVSYRVGPGGAVEYVTGGSDE